MEFKIKKSIFLEGLSKVQGVVERKNTMPILSHVLLDATGGLLKISATDLEVGLVTVVEANVVVPGKITLLSRSLYDIVRELDGDLHLTLKENDRVEILAGRGRYMIPGLNANDYPNFPKVEGLETEFSNEMFLDLVEKTAFSISAEETRHHLAGIYLHSLGDGILRVAATDGHRLSYVEKKLESSLAVMKAIIPRKGVNEMKKLLSGGEKFHLVVGEKNLFMTRGRDSLYVRLIDGDYPDYQRIIPKDNELEITVPRLSFMGALKRVSLLSNEKTRGVLVVISPGHVEMSIKNTDLGEAHEEIEINYQGPVTKIGFNARYFIEALSVIADNEFTIRFKTELAPCIVTSPKESYFTHVIMPMRL